MPPVRVHLREGTQIASGTLFGTPWVFDAVSMTCPKGANEITHYATSFELIGTNGLNCGGPNLNSSPNAAGIEVVNLSSGERVACGYVPTTVTSVTVNGTSGSAITQNVLKQHAGTKAFFVLSLEKIGKACYFVCHGLLTFKFLHNSTVLSAQKMQLWSVVSSGLGFTISSAKSG